MRYSPEHKAQSRARLLDAAGRHAKRHGFAASGVDALAAAAGFTSGALYRHFPDKETLFIAVVQQELAASQVRFARLAEVGPEALDGILRAYLSGTHLRRVEEGCALPALAAEVARASDPVRHAFAEGLEGVHALLQAGTGDAHAAWRLLAQAVGAVLLARALPPGRAQHALLAATRDHGICADTVSKA